MDLLVIGYFLAGAVVATMIYGVNRQIRWISGPSIQDRLFEISLRSSPFQGRWGIFLVTGIAYILVAVSVVVGWPYTLVVNLRKWSTYKPPMSDNEYKAALRELRLIVQSASPMGPDEIRAERGALRYLVSRNVRA